MPASLLTKRHTAMRELWDRAAYHREQARFLAPRLNELAVGSTDFDHTLKAVVAEAYLRVLRRGGSPQEAQAEAAQDGDACVRGWNESGHMARCYFSGPHELERWEQAGRAEADAVHLYYMGLLRGARRA